MKSLATLERDVRGGIKTAADAEQDLAGLNAQNSQVLSVEDVKKAIEDVREAIKSKSSAVQAHRSSIFIEKPPEAQPVSPPGVVVEDKMVLPAEKRKPHSKKHIAYANVASALGVFYIPIDRKQLLDELKSRGINTSLGALRENYLTNLERLGILTVHHLHIIC